MRVCRDKDRLEIDHVGYLHRYERSGESGNGKRTCNGREQYVAETQSKSDSYVETHTSFHFSGRQRHSYQCQYEGGSRGGITLFPPLSQML